MYFPLLTQWSDRIAIETKFLCIVSKGFYGGPHITAKGRECLSWCADVKRSMTYFCEACARARARVRVYDRLNIERESRRSVRLLVERSEEERAKSCKNTKTGGVSSSSSRPRGTRTRNLEASPHFLRSPSTFSLSAYLRRESSGLFSLSRACRKENPRLRTLFEHFVSLVIY